MTPTPDGITKAVIWGGFSRRPVAEKGTTLSHGTVRVFIRPAALTARGQAYTVTTEDGLILIERTGKPEHDACRALVGRGIAGRLEVWDHERPYPRLVIRDITKAAKLTVEERDGRNPRIVPYRPFERE